MSAQRNLKLPITYADNLPFSVSSGFIHDVEPRLIQATETENVYTIDARFMPGATGIKGEHLYISDLLDEKKQKSAYTQDMVDAYLAESVPVIDTDTQELSFIAADGVALYTIDLSKLLSQQPADYDIQTVATTLQGKALGISIAYNGAPHQARFLNVTDLRQPGQTVCGNVYHPYGSKEENICERNLDHDGAHFQLYTHRSGYAQWGDGGGMSSWSNIYGIIGTCIECGLYTLDLTRHLCDTDTYWFKQSTEELNLAFVVNGTHYRPGKGGFGGMIFDVQRANGAKWSGELFTQGPVPARWRNRIPDNATIVDQRRLANRPRY